MKIFQAAKKKQECNGDINGIEGKGNLAFSDNRAFALNQLNLQDSVNQFMQKNRSFQNLPPIQRDTEIYNTTEVYDFDDGVKNREIVGSTMLAYLDPKDPKKGSEPGSGVQGGLMGYLKTMGYKRMIRGHLLNAQLGGLGLALNLYPITSQANSKHKNHVENKAKDYLKNEPSDGSGRRLKYDLKVNKQGTWKPDKPDVNFDCEISWEKDKKILVDESISSNPESGKTGKGVATKGTPSKGFKNKDLPIGWGGAGKGFSSINKAHTDTQKAMTINGTPAKDFTLNAGTGAIVDFMKGKIDPSAFFDYARDFIGDSDFDEVTEEQYLDWIDNVEGSPENKGLKELVEELSRMGATF